MKITPILSVLALSIGASNAAVATAFAINGATGAITDTATGMQFATITTVGGAGATPSGTGLNLTTVPGTGSSSSSYTIVISDPAYSLTDVEWNARGGTPIIMGGTPTSTQVRIGIDQAGSLTTGAGTSSQTWTLNAAAIANGTPTAYLPGNQFRHSAGGSVTEADHWNMVQTAPSLTGEITYTRVGTGTNSAASEAAIVEFGFCNEPIPEPSSSMLLCLAGLGLTGRRKR